MIIRIEPLGKSFKGVGAYLTHDLNKANTSERVDWTHTLNLASDNVGAAINEMYWTYRAANQLKREAGLKAGGRSVEKPVKHVSLNWHPSDRPSRDEMVAAVEEYMAHMGWSDRQAVLVAHNDRSHSHVHVILNTVSPIDGRTLDPGYEHLRASAWALAYEQERFQVHCAQRLKPYEEREPAPTREAWQKLKDAEKEFDKAEAERAVRAPDYFSRHEPAQWKAKEWKALHGHQKEQRTAFFAGGKKAYREVRNQIFREVRTEFRDEWNRWFRLRKEGFDLNLLGEIKKGILERQNAELEKRRDAACTTLREQRDTQYAGILKEQREDRALLRQRQSEGLRSYDLLDQADEHMRPTTAETRRTREEQDKTKDAFGAASDETTNAREKEEHPQRQQEAEPVHEFGHANENHKVRNPLDTALVGLGALAAIASVAEKLFDGFFGGTPAREPPKPQPRHTPRPEKNAQPRATERHQRAAEAQAEEAARLHAYWEERRRSRGRDRD